MLILQTAQIFKKHLDILIKENKKIVNEHRDDIERGIELGRLEEKIRKVEELIRNLDETGEKLKKRV